MDTVPDASLFGILSALRSARRGASPLLLLALSALIAGACSNPIDADNPRLVITSPIDTLKDDPRFDTLTAHIETMIRFEAAVDTVRFPIDRFTGTGLRVAVVCVIPDSVRPPSFIDIFSISGAYLDIPATGLPMRTSIPARYFQRYVGARLAAAVILLYEDANGNRSYDYGERIFGASEQSLFGYAEGKGKFPARFGEVRTGPNVFARTDQTSRPPFRAAPEYSSTIFIINVHGPDYAYNIPYPWRTLQVLFP